MLDLVHVRSFVAVADTGSFHAAARRLGLAQPTVSQHVRKLEEVLGAALIVRGHACCGPTFKGSAFLPHGRRLLRAAHDARSSLQTDRLVVGAASNLGIYLLPRLVAAFCERHGEMRIELSIAPNPVIVQRLQRGEVDVAVIEWWCEEAGYEGTRWRSESLVVIVPPHHPWAGRRTIAVEDLFGAPLLSGEPGTGTGHILRAAFGAEASARLTVAAKLGSTEAVKHAVAAGLGVSIVLEAAILEEAEAGSLRALSLDGIELRKSLFVVLPESTPGTASAAVFRDWLLSDPDHQHRPMGCHEGVIRER